MSKPDWKDAPEWAQWLACDLCGAWFWYASKPSIERWAFIFVDDERVRYAGYGSPNDSWKDTLERRP